MVTAAENGLEIVEEDVATDLRCASCGGVYVRHVVRLRLVENGHYIENSDGVEIEYKTVEQARYVAHHWPVLNRAPWSLSDSELKRQISIVERIEAEGCL